MEPCADTECVIQVSVECEACKGQMNELLSSINGDIDKGLVKFEGQVDPNIILKATARHTDHARIVSFKINHVKLHQGIRLPYGHGLFGYGYEHGPTMVPPTYHQPTFGPGPGPWPFAMPGHEPYLNLQHYPQYQQHSFQPRYPMMRNSFSRNLNHHFRRYGPSGTPMMGSQYPYEENYYPNPPFQPSYY